MTSTALMADVTVTTLALSRRDLQPAAAPDLPIALRRVPLPIPAFNRFLYTAIGGDLHWVDRLGWTHADWLAWLDRPEVETWVSAHEGAPVGYVELERQGDEIVEIAYFGVLAEVRGRRVGGHLLHHAAERGFILGADLVRVETCSLDAPNALPTYTRRGFRVIEERQERRALHPAPGPWPGARTGAGAASD